MYSARPLTFKESVIERGRYHPLSETVRRALMIIRTRRILASVGSSLLRSLSSSRGLNLVGSGAAVKRVLHPTDHHLFIGRIAPSNRLLRIGVVLVLIGVVEMGGYDHLRSLRQEHRFLQVIHRLPVEAELRHPQQRLASAVRI